MRRYGMLLCVLCLGFALGQMAPSLVKAAVRVGDHKFDNQFMKGFVATPDRPLLVRVAGGADYTVIRIVGVEDDYVEVQLKSKDAAEAYLRTRDIAAVSQPTN